MTAVFQRITTLCSDRLEVKILLLAVCRLLTSLKGDYIVLHEPASSGGRDDAAPYKSRLGIWMFLLYAIFYAGFVAINLCNPLLMENIVVFGLNLATVYGFSLIIGALILACIYNKLCSDKERLLESQSQKVEGK